VAFGSIKLFQIKKHKIYAFTITSACRLIKDSAFLFGEAISNLIDKDRS
jgi:hypothetical protein